MRVFDPNFGNPKTHGRAITCQREIFKQTLVEVAYVGRKGVNLYGAYNVNQAEYRSNGFLDAFNIVKGGGESTLMNQLLAPDTRRQATATGSQMVRRMFADDLTLNNAAGLAGSFGSRIQVPRAARARGPRPVLLLSLSPVPRRDDRDRLRGLLAV
jgi:hypothetical protein